MKLVLLLLFLMSSSCQFIKGNNVNSKSKLVTLEEAIEIGRKKLISDDELNIWHRKLRIEADDTNTSWKKFAGDGSDFLDNSVLKKEYWAIYYTPTYEEDIVEYDANEVVIVDGEEWPYETITLSFSAYVFVEKYTGEVLDVHIFH